MSIFHLFKKSVFYLLNYLSSFELEKALTIRFPNELKVEKNLTVKRLNRSILRKRAYSDCVQLNL